MRSKNGRLSRIVSSFLLLGYFFLQLYLKL